MTLDKSRAQSAGTERGEARPTKEAIYAALKRLCTKGVRPYWIKDYCSELLMLRGVEKRLLPDANRDEAVDALVSYLRDLVEQIGKNEDRIVLTVVLGLDTRFLDKTAVCRRTVAGESFRDGSDPVRAGTIRQYHEPRALEKLCALILKDEDSASDAI
jgi:hypothetical protein